MIDFDFFLFLSPSSFHFLYHCFTPPVLLWFLVRNEVALLWHEVEAFFCLSMVMCFFLPCKIAQNAFVAIDTFKWQPQSRFCFPSKVFHQNKQSILAFLASLPPPNYSMLQMLFQKKGPALQQTVMHKCIFQFTEKKNRNIKSNIQMVKHNNRLWGCHSFVDVPKYNGKTFHTKSALGWSCWSREVLDNVCRRVPQSAHKGFYLVSSKNEVTQEYGTWNNGGKSGNVKDTKKRQMKIYHE